VIGHRFLDLCELASETLKVLETFRICVLYAGGREMGSGNGRCLIYIPLRAGSRLKVRKGIFTCSLWQHSLLSELCPFGKVSVE
jgi:hypothetical protein